MDQIKKLLSKLAKIQFWIITTVAVLLGIAGYFLASSEINKLYTAQKQALDKNFGDIKTVSAAVPTHPNSSSQQKMSEMINSLSDDVSLAWGSQYERQSQFLQWPQEINNPQLIAKMKKYYPVEIKLTYPDAPRDIAKTELQSYATYFDQQMPRLAQIIGVDWVGKASAIAAGGMGMGMGSSSMGGYGASMGRESEEGGSAMGGYGSAMGGYGSSMGGYGSSMGGYGGSMGGYGGSMMGTPGLANKPPDLVTWLKPSQDELINEIRLWRSDTPSVYEVYYTQENMWILEGLLNIIHKTNGNAIANFQCAIKEIKFLRIGKPAMGKAGVIDMPGAAQGGGMGGYGASMAANADGADGEGEASPYAYGDDLESGGEDKGGVGEAVVNTSDPANNRYVDANFEPVSGDDLRTKMQSTDPSDAYFAVAKRIPVRMRFKIDQRKTQEFLANCGNADLMFEVSQVRLGDTTPAASGGAAAGGMGGYGASMAGMMGGGASSMGGYGSMMGGGGGKEGSGGYGDSMGGGYGSSMGGYGSMMGGGGGMMGMGAVEGDPWELDIEVYGVVYLFNPVDIERLGVEKVTEETELATTVEPTVEPTVDPAVESTTEPKDVNTQPPADIPTAPTDGSAPMQPSAPAAEGVPANPGAPVNAGTPDNAGAPVNGTAQPNLAPAAPNQ